MLSMELAALFLGGGLLAGFIDAIAGGGGLITLPLLALALGTGVHAIGTNKINGTIGALAALIVYARKGHLDWRSALSFTAAIGCGSLLGSFLAPLLSPAVIRGMIIGLCPVLLFVIWRKDGWVRAEAAAKAGPPHWLAILGTGLAVGVYDGAFGPGGGTFMLLGLVLVAQLPLLPALAASKLANATSAGVGLASYGLRGYIHWAEGATMATGMLVGAWLGAQLASRFSARIVRPLLAVVVTLLLIRLLL